MPVPPALTQFFSGSSRSRGDDYARGNRVRLVTITPSAIDAVVRGGEMYAVRLACEIDPDARAQELQVSCTCPFFEDGADTCKHLWATLVVASNRRDTFLAAMEDARPGQVTLQPLLNADLPPLAPTPASRPAASSPPPSPSRRFLSAVKRGLTDVAAAPVTFRYRSDDLIYVLDLNAAGVRGLVVEIMTRQPKKTGGWSQPRPARITAVDLHAAPREDAEILSALAGATQAAGAYGGEYALPFNFPVTTALARLVVPLIAKTGRAFIRRHSVDPVNVLPIAWDDGPPWTFVVNAIPFGGGHRLEGMWVRENERASPAEFLTAFESGFLVSPTKIARAILPVHRALFGALLGSGPIVLAPDEVTTLAETLAQSGASSAELPNPLRVDEVDVAPVRRLSLRPLAGPLGRDLEAAVSFDYDGTVVDADVVTSAWDPKKRRLVRRRLDDETKAMERVAALGISRRWDPLSQDQVITVTATAMPRVVRTLIAEGWHVEAEGKVFQRPSRVAMTVSSGIDWFDLQATVEFAGETVPLTDVLAALQRGDVSVRLGDGSMGLLPEQWLERYAPLAAMGEADGDRLRFRLPQTALLDALLAAQADEASVTIDATFDAARKELARFDRIDPADPPASFVGELRPYQKDGLGWLGFLRRFGFGGCLADDMGLGKTVMVLAMLDAWRRDRPAGEPFRPSLVVAPRSVVHNWIAEAARFTPALRVRDHSHASRKANADACDDADVVMATYGTLRRDITEMKDREFDYVILDEAQAIKNANTASAKAARLLRAKHRLALSGTPIENHLGELWSLFEFLNPGLLGRSSVFASAGSTSRTVDPETATVLARGVRPFILRRTKAQVATDLPPKTEQTLFCDLEGRQRTFYNSLRTHYRQTLLGRIDQMGLAKSKIHVLEALLRLRQAACHPGLVDAASAKAPSAKLDALIPLLREVVDEGHKALVFSQFTSFLTLVKHALEKEGLVYEYLDGHTRDRAAAVDRFQTDPACPVFLVSLKAGGLGLNLTAAEYVFLLDPWWNPAVEAQAIDRAHRIGQTEHVFAYRLIARDTVEEKVLALQQTKRSLADAILNADAGLIGQLGREDLELLLS